jgi:acyl-CoA thioester hydrolase
MDPVFRIEIKVTEEVVDANRHVNNVAYVQWMQDAAIRHADSAGCTALTLELGATWVARTHHIEYRKPAFAGDTIWVLTWVANFRKVFSLRKYKFVRVADGALLALAETDWVLVDAHTGRARAVPDAIQNAFQLVPAEQEP